MRSATVVSGRHPSRSSKCGFLVSPSFCSCFCLSAAGTRTRIWTCGREEEEKGGGKAERKEGEEKEKTAARLFLGTILFPLPFSLSHSLTMLTTTTTEMNEKLWGVVAFSPLACIKTEEEKGKKRPEGEKKGKKNESSGVGERRRGQTKNFFRPIEEKNDDDSARESLLGRQGCCDSSDCSSSRHSTKSGPPTSSRDGSGSSLECQVR